VKVWRIKKKKKGKIQWLTCTCKGIRARRKSIRVKQYKILDIRNSTNRPFDLIKAEKWNLKTKARRNCNEVKITT
jgi:hypothetical protein